MVMVLNAGEPDRKTRRTDVQCGTLHEPRGAHQQVSDMCTLFGFPILVYHSNFTPLYSTSPFVVLVLLLTLHKGLQVTQVHLLIADQPFRISSCFLIILSSTSGMLSMSSPSLPESGFVPRKEFIRDQHTNPNYFALLALSSSNSIRLYSFAPAAIHAFRHLFEERGIILASREDTENKFFEFSLDGKPWAYPKAVTTEKLLLDILAVIFKCGYSYLSTIDYGREQDDRLAMAFSKPMSSPLAPTRSPPTPSSPFPDASTSHIYERSKDRRVPFALSFTSATLLRVIYPPLHLTPAILQAVRGSWPRGVVSEKSVGDNSFEFKLKGYKCGHYFYNQIRYSHRPGFQQDTFAEDSLRHILSLLTSLDMHSFSLLASISLTGRSRVKDLWIFTGPAPPEDPALPEVLDHSALDNSLVESRGLGVEITTGSRRPQNQHRKHVTEPASLPSNRTEQPAPQAHLLRKPAPRAQIPISAVHDTDIHDHEPSPPVHRANLPSTISSGIENMTGVGAIGNSPAVLYSPSPYDVGNRMLPLGTESTLSRPRNETPPERSRLHLRPTFDQVKTLPLAVSGSPSSSPHRKSPTQDDSESYELSRSLPAQPLLSPGTFRDSAFSGKSEKSLEIPIKRTGPANASLNQDTASKSKQTQDRHHFNGPILSGGWQPTPIDEKVAEDATRKFATVFKTAVDTRIHETGSRVESPEVILPDATLRQSEAALVGMTASKNSMPPVVHRENTPRKESQNSVGGASGQGWVLVNVEGGSPMSQQPNTPRTLYPPSGLPSDMHGISSIVPNAKAIAIMDAVNSKHKKSRSASNNKAVSEGVGNVRRFFSLNRKNSVSEFPKLQVICF